MAPIIGALERDPRFQPITFVTAQHREMLDQVTDLFGITPDVDLDVCRHGQPLSEMTARMLAGLAEALDRFRPDVVMVQGDTTSAFVGALAAYYRAIPVVHVEAGLRTGDLAAPFPEEGNRRLVGSITDLHLAPTAAAAMNLDRENVRPEQVVVTGNTVIDALQMALARSEPEPAELAAVDPTRPLLLVTTHRRESWGEPMRQIGRAIAQIAAAEPELQVVLPVHKNPAVRNSLLPELEGTTNLHVMEPLPYGAFCQLLARATVILTDSGGVQEEAPSLGKPVLVLRDTTERPEAVRAGTVRLVGTERLTIVETTLELLRNPVAYSHMTRAVNPYGDGLAARRSAAALAHRYLGGPPAEPFVPATTDHEPGELIGLPA
jgi:UDP-N-acetylglucosamine 2-epimerase (non-hydrolysing)